MILLVSAVLCDRKPRENLRKPAVGHGGHGRLTPTESSWAVPYDAGMNTLHLLALLDMANPGSSSPDDVLLLLDRPFSTKHVLKSTDGG